MKKLIVALTAVFSLTLALAAYGYFFLRNSIPPMEGTLRLPGLSAETQVLRDKFGIPHIYAQNKKDALRALGFVFASERLFQMEMGRRMTQGELAEVFGEIALPSDKLYRSLMLKRSVKRMLAYKKEKGLMDPEMWSEMQAFYDGINHYIETQPLPYELTVLGIKPRPFEALDAYVMTGHMGFSFSIGTKADALMSDLYKKLPLDMFQELRNHPLPLSPSSEQVQGPTLVPEIEKAIETAMNYYPAFEGSNSWLIAPSKSQSGKSIFANDPHIAYSQPAVWIEAHIHTPEFELYGHYLPSIPYALLGHSRRHAWGFTMSLNDDMDLYYESVNRLNQSAVFNREWKRYSAWNEIIKVKDRPDVLLPMIETDHGPLLNHILDGQDISLKWAFHKIDNDPLTALYQMGKATDIVSFEEALKAGSAPGLNVMYADDKNIAWWTFGDIAIKKNPHSDMIMDGASGDDEYERVLTWEEKPHMVNPESGFIVTANSRPASLQADIRGDWQSDNRLQTIYQLLEKNSKWTAEDTMKMQTLNFNYRTEILLKTLLENLDLSPEEQSQFKSSLESLRNWNRESTPESKAAALFHEWNNQNIRLLLKPLTTEEQNRYLATPYAWVFYDRVMAETNSPWWKPLSQKELITLGFRQTLQNLAAEKNWGSLHTIEYKHPMGRTFPLNKVLNIGPYPMPGAFNEINNNKMKRLGEGFQVVAGPSTRRIIDFASPEKSYGINPIGISGHILSPFYGDQVDLFLKGSYRKQLMDESEIKKSTTHVMTLMPH